jgi:hypothetical protein
LPAAAAAATSTAALVVVASFLALAFCPSSTLVAYYIWRCPVAPVGSHSLSATNFGSNLAADSVGYPLSTGALSTRTLDALPPIHDLATSSFDSSC